MTDPTDTSPDSAESADEPQPASRLDAALAERGLARSRTHAATLVTAGLVTVDGRPVAKVAAKVTAAQIIEVAASDHYVSRAAHKLIGALDAFPVPVAGVRALDAGASTGGFSQVLLERGAAEVVALDVGHDQLAPSLKEIPELTSVEGVNVRYLTPDVLEGLLGHPYRPTLVVADLSFISLRHVLPALVSVADPDADFVLLIKPQFEVGRGGVREGIVRDAGLRTDAIERVLWAAWDVGLRTAGLMPSPIAGSAGNREYLVWFTARTADGSDPANWREKIVSMVAV